jgi:hypothetical protein
MQLDSSLNFFGVCVAVAESCLDERSGQAQLLRQCVDRITLCLSEVLNPKGHFPNVRSADEAGPAASGPVTECDKRMLVSPGALFRIPAKAIGESFTRRFRPQP